jgi:hypothetical protein
MTVTVAMVAYAIGYALAAATRREDGCALVLPVPARLRRFVQR